MRPCRDRPTDRVRDRLDVAVAERATRPHVDEERTYRVALARIRAVPPRTCEPGEPKHAFGCAHEPPILQRMTVAYLGLGANLGDRAAALRGAIDALATHVDVIATSSVYETAPWGGVHQPAFLNCCVAIDTHLDPDALLTLVKRIETALGRVPSERWGPRAIDIDVLLYDEERVTSERIVVPHPRLVDRAFVLVPLVEIAPDAPIAGTTLTARAALDALPRIPDDVRRVAPPIVPSRDTAR